MKKEKSPIAWGFAPRFPDLRKLEFRPYTSASELLGLCLKSSPPKKSFSFSVFFSAGARGCLK